MYCIKTTDRQSFKIDNDQAPDDWILTVEHFYMEQCPTDDYAQTVQAVNHVCQEVHLPYGPWRSSMMRVP